MTTILSADIGGTKTLIECSQLIDGHWVSIRKQTLDSPSFQCFSNLLAGFLDHDEKIDMACLAIAGPIVGDKHQQTAEVTNLPWKMRNETLQKEFNIPKIHFINDFQAMGYSIDHLPPDDLHVLQKGKAVQLGVRAIIGAGTGLGEAILIPIDQRYEVFASEGGHQDFAPNDEQEVALYQYLKKTHQHVSYERILSGPGLVDLFRFLCLQSTSEPQGVNAEIINNHDPAAAISQANKDKKSVMAEQSLSLFMKIYGAQAGNLALACLPTGGIYITGGIAAKNISCLKNSEFVNSFSSKGRMQAMLKDIPIKVITNQQAGLIGATQYAISMVK